jgi:hypothetical protein
MFRHCVKKTRAKRIPVSGEVLVVIQLTTYSFNATKA